MADRDDMVVNPRLNLGRPGSAAPGRARVERRYAGSNKPGGIWQRVARAKARARLRNARTKRYQNRATEYMRGGAPALRGLGSVGGAGATRGARALATPIGAIIATVVVAGVAAIRLGTGRSLENMGAQVNKMLLGDADERARAATDVRKRMSGDTHLARIAAQEGAINSQISAIGNDLRKMRMVELTGQSQFLEDKRFQVNNTIDILILRARDYLTKAFNSAGGQGHLADLRSNLQAHGGEGSVRMGSGR